MSIKSPVFWLLIGTNDMGWAWCSPEVTLIGILRVVEELRAKKPGSTIVINSLLPRTFDKEKGKLLWEKEPGHTIDANNPPSLWKDIQAINEQLEKYSRTRDNVEFFDVNDIFLKDTLVAEKDMQINKDLMGDYLHPSASGYKLWGDEIVKKLDFLLTHNPDRN